jgi:phage terminase large subunit-like protein
MFTQAGLSFHALLQEYDVDVVRNIIEELPENEAVALLYDWNFWARPSQLEPDWEWDVWFLKSGRGSGKTRVGSEFINKATKTIGRIHLIGRTSADVRDTMIEGESGILECSPPWWKPKYQPSKRKVTWPNGATALCFSADEPDLLRGPQCGAGWADEIASWRYAQETWDNFMFGLRLGDKPRAVATSTPRPIKLVKDLVARHMKDVHVTTESTYANIHNVAPSWATRIIGQYEGTRKGRQELGGEVLDDNPNALWARAMLDGTRVREHPELQRVVVGVDPQSADVTSADLETATTAETGIVVGGIHGRKGASDAHLYVLDDMSVFGSPREWGEQAISAYHKYSADKIVAESNNGGAMVKFVIQSIDNSVPVELVTASRGKRTRAEPISSIYEQKRAHHVGMFVELEDQMCEWEPGEDSPDRMDALVWLATDLMLGEVPGRIQAR